MANNTLIEEFLEGKVDLIGFADLCELEKSFPDLFANLNIKYPYAVSIGKSLSRGVLDTIIDRPNPLYFSHYRQINYLLDRVTLEVASLIEKRGFSALPVPASQYISRDPYAAHICHRRIAWQAGLGSRGLNNLLVNPVYGSAVRLASVLTDMKFETAAPVEDGCVRCERCVYACPAGAVASEPEGFDLSKCLETLEKFRKIPFVSQHICGVCISVCRGGVGDTKDA